MAAKQEDASAPPSGAPTQEDVKRIKELEAQLATANSKAEEADNLRLELSRAKANSERVDNLSAQLAEAQQQIADANTKANQSEAHAFRQVREDKKIKVKILNGEGEVGKKAAFACVNGLEFFIPRNVEVDLPRCVYQNLLNAVIPDPSDGKEVPRYNIQVIV